MAGVRGKIVCLGPPDVVIELPRQNAGSNDILI